MNPAIGSTYIANAGIFEQCSDGERKCSGELCSATLGLLYTCWQEEQSHHTYCILE